MTAPKPVHEETWEHSGRRHVECDGETIAEFCDIGGDPTGVHALQRADLAAAAPDLARALLEVEWSGTGEADLGETPPRCPSCEAYANLRWSVPLDPTSTLLSDPHKPDCALDAALRKAGVR